MSIEEAILSRRGGRSFVLTGTPFIPTHVASIAAGLGAIERGISTCII